MARVLIFAVFSITIALSSAETAVGQSRQAPQYRLNQRYRPSRPTFSPYMDYFRQDVGLLDPYNYFTQRNRRLQGTLTQQQFDLNRQSRSLDLVGYQLQQLDPTGATPFQSRFAPVGALPTGKGASFQTHLRYYTTR